MQDAVTNQKGNDAIMANKSKLISCWVGWRKLKERAAEGGLGLSASAARTSANTIVWRMMACRPLFSCSPPSSSVWLRPKTQRWCLRAPLDAYEAGGEEGGKGTTTTECYTQYSQLHARVFLHFHLTNLWRLTTHALSRCDPALLGWPQSHIKM